MNLSHKSPDDPAYVYALADKAGVRYVGCSVNPIARMATHRPKGHPRKART